MKVIELELPFNIEMVSELRAGQVLSLSGEAYTARDAAHKKIIEILAEPGGVLPFALQDQTIYYMGPTPTAPGRAIGSAGPTTSIRMDTLTEPLLQNGLRAMIGKGPRSPLIKEALRRHRAVYLATFGGCGALLGNCIVAAQVVAFPELGCEAPRRLTLKDFPVIVAGDMYGGDIFA